MIHQTYIRLAFVLFALPLVAGCLRSETRQHLSESDDGTFYFHGTIDQTLEVDMILTRHGKQIDGNYMSARHRKAVTLKGQIPAPFEYEIEEFGSDGTVAAHFKMNELGGLGHPTGTWESTDGKRMLPVVLGEITPEQHQLLQKIWDSKLQITSLIAAFDHACVGRTIGTLCWGNVPQMPSLALAGPGRIAHRALPNLLIDENVTAITNASGRVCVLQSASLRCSQLYDPRLQLTALTPIPGFEQEVTMIGASGGYVCGVVAGALKCWDGSSLTAGSVMEIIPSGVIRLSSGDPQCVLMSDGGLKCWSMEYQQQEKRPKLIVQDISGLKGEIRSLSASGLDEQHFACAVDSEGLKCWGNNFARPLGRRSGGVRNLPPAPIAGLELGVTAVATELNHSCAIKEGKVYCWGGFNFMGELGDGTAKSSGEAVEVQGLENAVQVAVGFAYSCALTRDNRVFCWGDNEFGQTGNTSHDLCGQPNGHADAIETPCNRHPVEVRGLE